MLFQVPEPQPLIQPGAEGTAQLGRRRGCAHAGMSVPGLVLGPPSLFTFGHGSGLTVFH